LVGSHQIKRFSPKPYGLAKQDFTTFHGNFEHITSLNRQAQGESFQPKFQPMIGGHTPFWGEILRTFQQLVPPWGEQIWGGKTESGGIVLKPACKEKCHNGLETKGGGPNMRKKRGGGVYYREDELV